jgi:hypothetical protein
LEVKEDVIDLAEEYKISIVFIYDIMSLSDIFLLIVLVKKFLYKPELSLNPRFELIISRAA